MTGESTITVRCSCGKKLKAPAESAGRKARCPACKNVLVLEPSEAAPVAVAAVSAGAATTSRRSSATRPMETAPEFGLGSGDDDGLGAMYELSEQANNAPAVAEGPQCPSCRAPMGSSSVFCTNCGYDTRTGKALTTTKEAPVLGSATPKSIGKNKQVDMMAPQGSFMFGLLLASVFGIVCSILWIVVMFATGYEIGILATVVGWTVGLGMQIGQKGFSTKGGTAAAIIAAVAIVGPKQLLFAFVMAFLPSANAGKVGFELFHPLTIVFVFLGIGAAYRTANGAGK